MIPAYSQVLPCCSFGSTAPRRQLCSLLLLSQHLVAQDQNPWHNSNPPKFSTACHALPCQEGLFLDHHPHDEGNPSVLLPRADPAGQTSILHGFWSQASKPTAAAFFPAFSRVSPALCVHLLQADASSALVSCFVFVLFSIC